MYVYIYIYVYINTCIYICIYIAHSTSALENFCARFAQVEIFKSQLYSFFGIVNFGAS